MEGNEEENEEENVEEEKRVIDPMSLLMKEDITVMRDLCEVQLFDCYDNNDNILKHAPLQM